MKLQMRRPLEQAAQFLGISQDIIVHFIAREWITPVDRENLILDEEDIARVYLIWELKCDLGVNDEAVPIILHLIDQLNWNRTQQIALNLPRGSK